MTESSSGTTRRTVLTSAGVAGATGLGMNAPPRGRRGRPDRRREAGGDRGRVPRPDQPVGARRRDLHQQRVPHRRRRAAAGDLFAGSPPAVGTALFTAHATGELERPRPRPVRPLPDIVGELTSTAGPHPGPTGWIPAPSQRHLVARYDAHPAGRARGVRPGDGLPTFTGEMRQTFAGRVGRGGGSAASHACCGCSRPGLGTLIDPVTLNADLEIAGNWSVP